MLPLHSIKNLLDLQGVIVTNCVLEQNNILVYADQEKVPCNCPHCGKATSLVHDYRKQKIKHIPFGDNAVYIILNKRRLYCPVCEKSFYQKPAFLPRYFQ